ncbi:MAG TPA: cupin domain-containing protein [Gaiellaceae bacterium]|nr:cupin domain-containing protein [Gaiellaceae bacterium]
MTEAWYVRNARDYQWFERGPRGKAAILVDNDEAQVGVNLFVLGPGEPMAMYHWEADQEDYLVLSGEALLICDDEERHLKQWDFVHTPPDVPHVLVGAGDGPCVIVAIGAREHQDGEGWGGYPLSDVAAKHNAATEEATNDAKIAYARFPAREAVDYGGWLD